MASAPLTRIAFAVALVAGAEAAPAQVPASSPTPAGPERLVAAPLFTASFLARVAEVAAALRLEEERLTMTYLQEKAGLLWSRTDNGVDLDWHEANEYCRELDLAGYTDWRLPSLDELEGLHDRRSTGLYKLPAAFKLSACCQWSASRSGDSSAWNFSFRFRKRFSGSLNYSYGLRALCVRQALAADLEFFARAAEEAERKRKEERKKKKRT